MVVKNLNVAVAGQRPRTLRETGDAAFERSRGEAKKAHDEVVKVTSDKRQGVKYARNLLELVSAEKHNSPVIINLADTWVDDKKLRRIEEGDQIRFEGLSESHIKHSRGALRKFSRFMAKKHPLAKDMSSVRPEQIEAYMKTIEDEKLSARSWNYSLTLLREMFNRHEPGSAPAKALMGMDHKAEETQHRKPFTEEELLKILEASKKDPEIASLIEVGVNTPLRLGDGCKLRWDMVNLKNKFLNLRRTSKTTKPVSIPIWDSLYEVLEKQPKINKFVFPALAELYTINPTGLNSRLREVFAAAGIAVHEKKKGTRKKSKSGQTAPGPRQVNESAFQAFRVTWVTRALKNNVPEEIVRKATGHTTVDIVREHYFQPDAEDMRYALEGAKPGFTKVAQKVSIEAVIEVVKGMTSETWKQSQTKALELLNLISPTR